MSRLRVCSALLLALTFMCRLEGEDSRSYQKTAAAALKYEIVQIGKDCANANNRLEINTCLGDVRDKRQSNFRTFYTSLRNLLSSSSNAAQQLDTRRHCGRSIRRQLAMPFLPSIGKEPYALRRLQAAASNSHEAECRNWMHCTTRCFVCRELAGRALFA
jgi:hypothetical protein